MSLNYNCSLTNIELPMENWKVYTRNEQFKRRRIKWCSWCRLCVINSCAWDL